MRRTFIFFILSFKLVAQNGAPIFEFNQDFKDQVCSFKDLTDELFREDNRLNTTDKLQHTILKNGKESTEDN